ncbi:MAG: NAD(P)/FAD-dependent oxidoreductase [Calditrichaeota bacterium]|nr:NAD(P)/FAD-dependent oxidoreductase [Calditrichota bacterium]
MTTQPIIYDCVILGAGPAGMTAAIFAQAKGLNVVILEGAEAGGQLKSLYPYKPVYNYPGYSNIPAGNLADRMIEQVKTLNIPLLENRAVEEIRKSDKIIFKISGKNFVVFSRSVILASGLGLSEPRRLDVAGEKELEGKGVEFSIKNVSEWAGKNVSIIGGGNSAIDNAMLLLEQNAQVILIHRTDKLRAEPKSIKKLQQNGVQFYLGWKTGRFKQSNEGQIILEIEKAGQKIFLKIDKVLVNIGLKPNIAFLEKLEVDKKNKQILVNTEMQTSMPGIFGCGDAVSYPGKVRLIVTALGEAATAVNALQRYLKSLPHPVREGELIHGK